MRWWLLILALVLSGCSQPGQGIAFVVNRTGQAAGQGKSYSFPVAGLEAGSGQVTLAAGEDVRLVASVSLPPAEWVGKNLPLSGGHLRLDGREVSVTAGQLSLQTLEAETYRGNFNARLPGGLEAVGYFEAKLVKRP